MSKFFEFSDNYDALTSYFATHVPALPTSGYHEIQDAEGRADLVSFRIYADTQYWWILLLYNNKTEYDDFKVGEKVKYPSVDDIEDLFFSLRAKQSAAEAAVVG